MRKFNNILIIRTDRIGDVVLTTPAIKALRTAYPLARISILVTPLTKDLVEGNPYLDEVILDDRSKSNKGLFGFLELARSIRHREFDVVFVFHTKRRYNLACFLAGVPVRIGYKNDKFGLLLTDPVKDLRAKGEKHESQYCLDLLRKASVEVKDFSPFIPLNKQAENWAINWLNDNELERQDLIAIHAGSSDPAKCWPVENFAKFINSLDQRYQIKVVLIGGSDTKERCAKIIKLCNKKPLDLTGGITLAQTASLLRRCKILLSNDSGPVHMASAVGTYVISIFTRNAPGINPERWKPLTDKGIYLFSTQGVQVQEVLETIERIFQKDHQKFFHW